MQRGRILALLFPCGLALQPGECTRRRTHDGKSRSRGCSRISGPVAMPPPDPHLGDVATTRSSLARRARGPGHDGTFLLH